jgi:hypothetical protein
MEDMMIDDFIAKDSVKKLVMVMLLLSKIDKSVLGAARKKLMSKKNPVFRLLER